MEAGKVLFKSQLAYRFDTVISTIFTVSKVLLAYVLWGAIFEKQSMISGFTFNSMLSYYIINSFITQLDQSSGTGWQIADEIRNGGFSKYMVRPMNVLGYFTAHTAGISAFLMTFNLIAGVLWVFMFRIEFVITGSVLNIVSSAALTMLGLLLMLQVNYFIGILAFKFLDISFFMMIKDNILQFVTGSLIPLTILPDGIIRVMSIFPFYYVSYLPSMLLLGRNRNEIATGFAMLISWNAVLYLLNSITYNRLRSRYEGVGI